MSKEIDPQELTDWYVNKARQEIAPMMPKILEYGGNGRAVDLINIGRDLAHIAKREVTDAEAAELGIYFYVVGKLGRWSAAIANGKDVSDDTLHDIAIYIKMVQRIREKGGWPV
jgi:hypothetical protein